MAVRLEMHIVFPDFQKISIVYPGSTTMIHIAARRELTLFVRFALTCNDTFDGLNLTSIHLADEPPLEAIY